MATNQVRRLHILSIFIFAFSRIFRLLLDVFRLHRRLQVLFIFNKQKWRMGNKHNTTDTKSAANVSAVKDYILLNIKYIKVVLQRQKTKKEAYSDSCTDVWKVQGEERHSEESSAWRWVQFAATWICKYHYFFLEVKSKDALDGSSNVGTFDLKKHLKETKKNYRHLVE